MAVKARDIVTLKADRTFVAEVLFDPQGGLVFVMPSEWGEQRPTGDGIVGLGEDGLEVAGGEPLQWRLPTREELLRRGR